MPLQIIRQDITKMRVDAIVNTTNEEKIGYSGVDLAVHTLAGSGLDEECAQLPLLGLGQAQITGGYNLPCKYVIHTSGPVWHGGLCGIIKTRSQARVSDSCISFDQRRCVLLSKGSSTQVCNSDDRGVLARARAYGLYLCLR